jgi:hypothetical protein
MGLKERQEELVRALVAGGADPDGCTNLEAAREQLLRKRAGEVGQAWPMLRASFGTDWYATFSGWAKDRPTLGSYRDGLEFAASVPLTGAALAEYEQRTRPQRKRWLRRRSR